MRLLAVDPSITCTGWALFDVASEKIIGVGKLKALPPTETLAIRLSDLSNKIEAIYKQIKLGSADIVICESPTTVKDPSAAFKVEQVRCLFENLARLTGAHIPGRINPRSVQYEVLGLKGKQLSRNIVKEMAVNTAQKIFGRHLEAIGFSIQASDLKKNQDIVDALLLGSLGLTRIKSAIASEQRLDIYLQSLETKSTRKKFHVTT